MYIIPSLLFPIALTAKLVEVNKINPLIPALLLPQLFFICINMPHARKYYKYNIWPLCIEKEQQKLKQKTLQCLL